VTYSSSARTRTSVTVSPLSSAHALAASHSGCGTRTERAGVFGWFGMSAACGGCDGGDLLVGPLGVSVTQPCGGVVGRGGRSDVCVADVRGDLACERGGGLAAGFVFVGGHRGLRSGWCIYTIARCMDTRQGESLWMSGAAAAASQRRLHDDGLGWEPGGRSHGPRAVGCRVPTAVQSPCGHTKTAYVGGRGTGFQPNPSNSEGDGMNEIEDTLEHVKAELREMRALAARVLDAAEREGLDVSHFTDGDLDDLLGGS